MLSINDYTSYTSADSTWEDVKNIFSYSWEEHIRFFDKNRNMLIKSNSGLCGDFSEKVFKDCFVLTKSNPYTFNGTLKKEIKTFLHNSPENSVDFIFETKEDNGVSVELTGHFGSGKNTYFSGKKVLSIADSDFNNEYLRSRDILKNYTRKEGWLVISSVINVCELHDKYGEELDCLNIVLFDESVFNAYINKDDKPRGLPKNFTEIVNNLLDSGWLRLHSMKRLYFEAREVLREYECAYNKYFHTIYGEKPFSLYFVQERLIEEALKKYSSGCNEVCITATVRSGKTTMAGVVSKNVFSDFRGKVIVLESFFPETFPTIVSDFRRAVGEENINVIDVSNGDIVVVNPDKMNFIHLSGQYTVCGEIKPMARSIISIADMLIYDEAHIGFGSTKQHSLRMYMKNDAKILALTATPGVSVETFAHVCFTEMDMIQSVLDGHKHYENYPIRLRISNNVFAKEGDGTVTTRVFDNASKLVSNANDTREYFKFIMNHCDNGINVTDIIERGKIVYNDVNFGVNFVRTYHPHNFIVYCVNWKDLKDVYKNLNGYAKILGNKRLIVHWTTSKGNSKGSSKNAVDFVNEVFSTCDDTYRFVLVVGQCGVGATIRNLEGVVMLNNTESYASYEQKSGRCCQPVFKNGRWLNYTFVFDPLAERAVSKIDNAKIKYLTKKNYYTDRSKEAAWVRSTNMCMDATTIRAIEPHELSDFIVNNELLKNMEMGVRGLCSVEWYKNALGVLNDFDVNDERFDFERVLKIIGYANRRELVRVSKNGSHSVIEYTYYTKNEEGELKETKIEINPYVILENLWRAFQIRIAMFSIGNRNRLHTLLDKNNDEEFFNALLELMNIESNGIPCWKQYFNDKIFNPNSCTSFNDILSIFYDVEDESKRYINRNTIRESIEKIIETVLSHSRGDVLRMLMTNNAVAEYGEVFISIEFIKDVIIPSIINRYGKKFFEKKTLKIADITCGSGNFLIALYPSVFEGQRKYFSSDEECHKHIIENVFYGNDIQDCHIVTVKHTLDYDNIFPNNPHFTCSDTLSKDFDFWGNTHFDLIIGNPPYQKYSSNGKSAKKIYKDFVTFGCSHSDVTIQLIKGDWINDTKTNKFKQFMTNGHLVELHNYDNSQLIFPTLPKIGGGCCWFIFDNAYKGTCLFRNYTSTTDYYESTIDFKNKSIRVFKNKFDESICKKVICSDSFTNHLSSTNVFGISDDEKSHNDLITSKRNSDKDIPIKTINGVEYIHPSYIKKNKHLINANKVCITSASNFGAKTVIPKAFSVNAGVACSYSYIVVTDADMSNEEVQNCVEYLRLRPVRQLIKQMKKTQHVFRDVYCLVPWQDFKTPWTEELFYETYGYTKEEIAYVNSEVNLYK